MVPRWLAAHGAKHQAVGKIASRRTPDRVVASELVHLVRMFRGSNHGPSRPPQRFDAGSAIQICT
jgi:hypothetical protein